MGKKINALALSLALTGGCAEDAPVPPTKEEQVAAQVEAFRTECRAGLTGAANSVNPIPSWAPIAGKTDPTEPTENPGTEAQVQQCAEYKQHQKKDEAARKEASEQ